MNVLAKRENWKIVGYIVGGLVIVGLIWFLVTRIFADTPPGPTENEKRADSLAATKAGDQALLDSSNARIRSREVASGEATRAALDAIDRANRAKRRADSLAIARRWESAYNARTEEAIDLRAKGASDATLIANLKADTTDLRQQLGIVNRRLATTEAVVVGLKWDLQQARNCKILGLVKCPSRIQTAALTAITVVAVDRYRSR